MNRSAYFFFPAPPLFCEAPLHHNDMPTPLRLDRLSQPVALLARERGCPKVRIKLILCLVAQQPIRASFVLRIFERSLVERDLSIMDFLADSQSL